MTYQSKYYICVVYSESGRESFDAETATTKQKGNFGEYKADYNLVHNQSLKDAGYDLKPIGRLAQTSLDDKIVKSGKYSGVGGYLLTYHDIQKIDIRTTVSLRYGVCWGSNDII